MCYFDNSEIVFNNFKNSKYLRNIPNFLKAFQNFQNNFGIVEIIKNYYQQFVIKI